MRRSASRAQLSETENAPTWRVYLGEAEAGIEIGAGWTRCGSRGIYVALQIDDPLFSAPISANLFDSRQLDGPHLLFWSRADASEKG